MDNITPSYCTQPHRGERSPGCKMEIGERQTQNGSRELPAQGEKHRCKAEVGAPPDTSAPPHVPCCSGLLACVPSCRKWLRAGGSSARAEGTALSLPLLSRFSSGGMLSALKIGPLQGLLCLRARRKPGSLPCVFPLQRERQEAQHMRRRAVWGGMQGGSRALEMLVRPRPRPPLPPEMHWSLFFPDLKEMS